MQIADPHLLIHLCNHLAPMQHSTYHSLEVLEGRMVKVFEIVRCLAHDVSTSHIRTYV